MATLVMTTQRPGAGSTTPRRPSTTKNLPVIEHPLKRNGDTNSINITGSARVIRPPRSYSAPRDYKAHTSLPEVGKSLQMNKVEKSKVSRMSPTRLSTGRVLQWPPQCGDVPFHSICSLSSFETRTPKLNLPEHKYGPEQLIAVIRTRLATGLHGLRQLFISNDIQGNGTIPREAMHRIVYYLCGYVTHEQVNQLIAHLGLGEHSVISFDSFISCFNDTEVVQKEWVTSSQIKTIEDHPKKMSDLIYKINPPEKTNNRDLTAVTGLTKLRTKLENREVSVADLIPPACLRPGGLVIPPQLREALAVVDVDLYDNEFIKLWRRLDLGMAGAIKTSYLFYQLGLDSKGQPRVPPELHQSRKDSAHEGDGGGDELVTQSRLSGLTRLLGSAEVTRRRACFNAILETISRKLQSGYVTMVTKMEKCDDNLKGLISRSAVRKVLSQFGITMDALDFENLVRRSGVRDVDSLIDYKEFSRQFQSRIPGSRAHAILSDPEHVFNTCESLSSFTEPLSAPEAEAMLVQYFHNDFLLMMASLRAADRHNTGVVTQRDFLHSVQKSMSIHFNTEQIESLKTVMKPDEDGCFRYNQFLCLLRYISK